MRIEWARNPLESKIILDDHDKEILKLKIRIQEYEEIIGCAHISLDVNDQRFYSPAKAFEYTSRYTNDEAMDKSVERMYGFLLHALEDDSHCGDCTCFPAPCLKCWAEDLVGIYTIDGLGKHSANKIDGILRTPDISLDEAIIKLLNPDYSKKYSAWDKYSDEEYFKHVPRWTQESIDAGKWLQKYKEDHFPEG